MIKTYSVLATLAAIRNAKRQNKKKFFIPGTNEEVRISSTFVVLANKGTTCVCCGASAVSFAYVITDCGRRSFSFLTKDNVPLTKDHIIPKSVGGSNSSGNYQTMCQVCNLKKGCSHDSDQYLIDVINTLNTLYNSCHRQQNIKARIEKFKTLFSRIRSRRKGNRLGTKQKWLIDSSSHDFFVKILQKHLQITKIKQKQIKKVPYERPIF